jgi:hypothetical protein
MTESFPYKNFSDAIEVLDKETDQAAREWLALGQKVSMVRMIRLMVSCFWRSYYKEGKRRLGVPGLFLSVNEGMRPFLTYAKLWELQRGRRTP